jgi:hypothetical protein
LSKRNNFIISRTQLNHSESLKKNEIILFAQHFHMTTRLHCILMGVRPAAAHDGILVR